jgi:hypothetical protein
MITQISEVITGIIVGLYNVVSEIIKNGHAKENVTDHIVRNEFIQNRLDLLLENTNADRACIFLFHNGGSFFSGQPMKKISCVYEAVSTGIIDRMGEMQNKMVSEYPLMHFSILQNNEFSIPDLNLFDDSTMKQKWENYGVKTFYAVGIWDLNGCLVGNVSISYIKEKNILSDDFKKSINDFSKTVSGYLVVNNPAENKKANLVSSAIVTMVFILTLSNLFFLMSNIISLFQSLFHIK